MDVMLRLHNDQSFNAAMQRTQDLGEIGIQHDGFVTENLNVSMLAPDQKLTFRAGFAISQSYCHSLLADGSPQRICNVASRGFAS